jgi:hypothetical protein
MKTNIYITILILFLCNSLRAQDTVNADFVEFAKNSSEYSLSGTLTLKQSLPLIKKLLDSLPNMYLCLNSRTCLGEFKYDSLIYYRRVDKLVKEMTNNGIAADRILIRNSQYAQVFAYCDNMVTGVFFTFITRK